MRNHDLVYPESVGTPTAGGILAQTYTREAPSPAMILRKSSRQRAQLEGGPMGATGLEDWTKQKRIKCGWGVAGRWHGDSRGLMAGPCRSSEGLSFAKGVARVLMFHKETGCV